MAEASQGICPDGLIMTRQTGASLNLFEFGFWIHSINFFQIRDELTKL